VTIRKILVAHDFSEPATRALGFAAMLAKETSATVELVHVMPDLYDGRGELALAVPPTLPGQGERYMRFLQEELERAVQLALPELAGKLPCHALRGDPVRRIEALAKEIGADVVCVGATGKGAVARVLLGSIAQLLLRTSTVPVLIVP
jgi:nucleotide-binding universal stress UspA family protein